LNLKTNLSRVLVLTMLAGVLTLSNRAQAQDESNADYSGIAAGMILYITGETLAYAGGVTTLVGSIFALTEDYPPMGWIVPAYLLGALNAGVGITYLATVYYPAYTLGFGLTHLALGIGNAVIASLCVHKRRMADLGITILPVMMADYRREPVMGLGIVFAP